MWRPLQLLKKRQNSKREMITGSLDCQNSPFCHVKVCYDNISQASPPIDYSTKNCSKQQQGDKFFSLFVYITCYFVIDHLNVIGWLNEDHSVFQKEELWLANICLFTEYTPFYYIRIFSGPPQLTFSIMSTRFSLGYKTIYFSKAKHFFNRSFSSFSLPPGTIMNSNVDIALLFTKDDKPLD